MEYFSHLCIETQTGKGSGGGMVERVCDTSSCVDNRSFLGVVSFLVDVGNISGVELEE